MNVKKFEGRFGKNFAVGQSIKLTSEGLSYLGDKLELSFLKNSSFKIKALRHFKDECDENIEKCTCGLYIDIVHEKSGIGYKDLVHTEIA